jgi:DNA excision repair protein ERCC-4
MDIVVDSREQRPLWTKDIEIKALNVGDYSLKGHEDKIAVERKSLQDLFGTLGSGHKRFKKELERAEGYDYFAIVVDGSYSDCKKKNFAGSFYSKMKGYVIIKILFTLHVKYKINIFFTNGRVESKQVIKSIFEAYITNISK